MTEVPRPPRRPSVPALHGITVVALGDGAAALHAAGALAELGARTIRIDTPTRLAVEHECGTSRAHAATERLGLNLERPQGREILFALLGRTDVLLQDAVPAADGGRGLSFFALEAAFPRLILCDVAAAAAREAAGAGVEAEAHVVTGLRASGAVVAALFARERTGAGRHSIVRAAGRAIEPPRTRSDGHATTETDAILAELGFYGRIEALRRSGAV